MVWRVFTQVPGVGQEAGRRAKGGKHGGDMRQDRMMCICVLRACCRLVQRCS